MKFYDIWSDQNFEFDATAEWAFLDTLIGANNMLQIIAEMRKQLDAMEALVMRLFNKPFTDQDGPGVDPSEPAPEANPPAEDDAASA